MFKSTVQITILSFLGIVLNLGTQLIVAYYFGTTTERDAYFGAIVIPTYLTSVMGAVSMIFLPMYVDIASQSNEQKADEFYHNVLSIFGLITVVVILSVSLFARNILSLTVPGFTYDQMTLTVELVIILLPTTLLSFATSLSGSVMQVQKRFIIPAVGPVISAVISLLMVWRFNDILGIRSLAYGTLLGGVINFFLVRIAVRKPMIFSFRINSAHTHLLIKGCIPLFIAYIFSKLTGIFERSIASTLTEGSVSYLGYANYMMTILSTLVSSGIAITIYPVISKAWSDNDSTELNRLLTQGVRIILLMASPIMIIFIFWGIPITQILLERGAFVSTATDAVSSAFSILTVALVANSLGLITAKFYYFSHKTVLVSIIDIVCVVLHFLLALLLSKLYSYKGIAMASSISAAVSILTQFGLLRVVSRRIKVKKIFTSFLIILLIAIAPALFLETILNIIHINITPIVTIFIVVIYFVGYYIILRIFKMEEIDLLQRKIGANFLTLLKQK